MSGLWPVHVHVPAPLRGSSSSLLRCEGEEVREATSDQVFGIMRDGGVACARREYSHKASGGSIPAWLLAMGSMLQALGQLAPTLMCDATHRAGVGVFFCTFAPVSGKCIQIFSLHC